ncbi:1-hydroxycarotenoid 3,4-desaturase CrtD [Fulvivirga lutea]|uniref:Phytoene desaturase n=1 Tax=Fulvivirga lutea TaxID=2810512 RepID=A0A974ZZD1_9BACT|nr:1-hydroxycarotenoid 3,4-desaturase CrtD [Fulvivirga lutea]QSE96039.1 phytoene desaturase [Fulvivirga lutea]
MKSALIIGSGIAGLASALRLKKAGFSVKVFEAANHAGGKLHAFQLGDFRFDMGPSLFTMPHLVDELFLLFDKNPKDYFNYIKKETVCNYFWEDGTRFSVPASEDEFVQKASDQFNVEENRIKKYLARNKEKYDLTADIFLNKSLHKWSTYLSFTTLKSLSQAYKLHLNDTLNGVNKKYFDNRYLVQLFNRYATYNGSSPFKTPGIMSMIPHLEMFYGTFLPKGGMHQISQSLYQLAVEQNIEFHFNEPVNEIITEASKAKGIKTKKGDYFADIVVSNTDVFTAYSKLLKSNKKPARILNQERSSSAVIFYWGIRKTFQDLDLHNILFSDNYKEEFNALFNDKTLYNDPTVYINITSKQEKKDAPEGCENWFVMVNAPGNFGQNWDTLIAELRKNLINKINRILKCSIEDHIVVEEILDPRKIETKTASHLGSLYGTSSNSKFSAFLRHSNFSKDYKNLYFCGGSVHPGGGIPLCLLSAKIATENITAHD